MQISQVELNILLLEQTLRNSKEHLQRCIRRRKEAEEAEYEAHQGIKKLERAIDSLRNSYLSGCNVDLFV